MWTSLLAVSLFAVAPDAAPKPKLAAPGLESINMEEKKISFFSDHLATQFTFEGIQVTTAGQVEAVIGLERQKQFMGCADDSSSCMTELANALGVDAILTGTIAKFDDLYQVNLKIVSAEDASALATYSSRVSGQKKLLQELDKAAPIMAKLMKDRLAAKRAQVAAAQAEAETESKVKARQEAKATTATAAKKDSPKAAGTTRSARLTPEVEARPASSGGAGRTVFKVLGYGVGGLGVATGLGFTALGIWGLTTPYLEGALLFGGIGAAGLLTGGGIIALTYFLTREEDVGDRRAWLLPTATHEQAGVAFLLRF